MTAIVGTVVVDAGARQPLIRLRQATGKLVLLIGAEALQLGSVDGADVSVRGVWDGQSETTWDTSPGFTVETFTVIAVGGRSATDGVLVESDGRYGLHLGRGEYRWFLDPPERLMGLVGARIWVTGSLEDPPLRFGVIAAPCWLDSRALPCRVVGST